MSRAAVGWVGLALVGAGIGPLLPRIWILIDAGQSRWLAGVFYEYVLQRAAA